MLCVCGVCCVCALCCVLCVVLCVVLCAVLCVALCVCACACVRARARARCIHLLVDIGLQSGNIHNKIKSFLSSRNTINFSHILFCSPCNLCAPVLRDDYWRVKIQVAVHGSGYYCVVRYRFRFKEVLRKMLKLL